MNYYYDPKVAAQLADYVNYICPVVGAKEAMQAIDPDLAKNAADLPDRRWTAPHLHGSQGRSETTTRHPRSHEKACRPDHRWLIRWTCSSTT